MSADVKTPASSPPPPALAKNYRLVHDIVMEQGPGVHLTMAGVHELAKRRKPAIGFTTVYRALTRLRDTGMISEIVLPGSSSAFYEPPAPKHAHFICETCGRVSDVEYTPPKRSIAELSRKYGVEVRETMLSLHGICSACLPAGERAAAEHLQ
jgi:Fe2+ or Zn2+ uptake regulation protein